VGVVSFYDGNDFLGEARAVDGKAAFTASDLTVQHHSITARFSGSLGYQMSQAVADAPPFNPVHASTAVFFQEYARAPSNTTLTASSVTIVQGQAATFTAVVTSFDGIAPVGV